MHFLLLILHLLIVVAGWTVSQKLHCPRNVPYFSTAPCSPDTTTCRCPPGYRCRPSRDENDSTNIYFICCAQADMNVEDYFLESEISPRAVPQVPMSMLQKVGLVDRMSGQRLLATGISTEISGVDRVQNDTASYGQLESVEFTFSADILAGHFLHFVLAQQPLSKPQSMHFYYDYPSSGTGSLNLTELDQRLRRGFVEFVSNETVTAKDFYRSMFVVLAFRTEAQLLTAEMLPRNMDSQYLELMRDSNGDLSKFLSSKLVSERLGVPIAGTYFFVTSKGTIFKTQEPASAPSLVCRRHPRDQPKLFLCLILMLLATKL